MKPTAEPLYKDAPPSAYPFVPQVQAPTYVQEPTQQPYQQPYPPQPQPLHARDEDLHPLPAQPPQLQPIVIQVEAPSPKEAPLTRADVEEIMKKAKEPAPPKEVPFKEKIRGMLEEHFASLRRVDEDPLIVAIKRHQERQEKLGEAIERAIKKEVISAKRLGESERGELVKIPPQLAPQPLPQHVALVAQPEAPLAQPEATPQPTEPPAQPATAEDIREAIEKATSDAASAMLRAYFKEEPKPEAQKAEEEKEPRETEKSEVISQSEKTQEEEPQREESQARIFPILRRRRRLRLLG